MLYPELHAMHPRDAGPHAAAVTRRFLDDVHALAGQAV